jgi:hypothetical protein
VGSTVVARVDWTAEAGWRADEADVLAARPEEAGGYLDGLDNLLERERQALARCGRAAVRGECECGTWQKVIRCGREWCPTCGQAGSERHAQRYARWLRRLQTVTEVGYWVVTWPPAMRAALKSPAALAAAREAVLDVLAAAGYEYMLARYHFTGDKNPDTWYPHLNVVVFGERLPVKLPKAQLKAIKATIRRVLGGPANQVIHYRYRKGRAALCHLARYITRPTWGPGGLEWETETALALRGWHNDVWRGKWAERPILWTLDGDGPTGALIALEDGRCPACGGAIRWQADVGPLVTAGAEEVAPGYWYTPAGTGPPAAARPG